MDQFISPYVRTLSEEQLLSAIQHVTRESRSAELNSGEGSPSSLGHRTSPQYPQYIDTEYPPVTTDYKGCIATELVQLNLLISRVYSHSGTHLSTLDRLNSGDLEMSGIAIMA
ncbi:GL10925 [Drosophila persimilis]|uniref:GL10925 n=1 Tax=Drosophila persimilis TaxID=7234 RepID=B4GCX1_DROPE|nr:GL10925 [Drosophila persimilis]